MSVIDAVIKQSEIFFQNWNETIFTTMGVAYVTFSTAIVLNWGFNIYKNRVAKDLARKLLASLELLDGVDRSNKTALIKRLEKLARANHRHPRDFAVALAAAHILRYEISLPASVFSKEIKRLDKDELLQIRENNSTLVSANELRKYSAIKDLDERKVGYLTDRLEQNLREVVNYHAPTRPRTALKS